MTAQELNPFDAAEEELAAFLDGELPPLQRQRMEQELANNPTLREKLHRTQQAWDALDLLPRSRANESFASTTVELTVNFATEPTQAHSLQSLVTPERLPWLRLVLAGIMALCWGVIVVRSSVNYRAKQAVKDFGVIEKYNELLDVPSIGFVKDLQKENLFKHSSHEQK
jgi:anti-sigma factor RsiW